MKILPTGEIDFCWERKEEKKWFPNTATEKRE